jgi:hypothetical protein
MGKPVTTPLKIGKYLLSGPIDVMGGAHPPYITQKHIWIEHESGEGMSVNEPVLAAVIDQFYRENF